MDQTIISHVIRTRKVTPRIPWVNMEDMAKTEMSTTIKMKTIIITKNGGITTEKIEVNMTEKIEVNMVEKIEVNMVVTMREGKVTMDMMKIRMDMVITVK